MQRAAELDILTWWHISIWLIDEILTGATTPSQSEPGSNGNEGGIHFP